MEQAGRCRAVHTGLGGLPYVEGGEGTFAAGKDRVSWPGRTAVAISLRVTLGKPLLSLKSESPQPPQRKSGQLCSQWVELCPVPLGHVLAACWLEDGDISSMRHTCLTQETLGGRPKLPAWIVLIGLGR